MKKNPTKAVKKAAAKAKRRLPGLKGMAADMRKTDKRMEKGYKALKKKRKGNG